MSTRALPPRICARCGQANLPLAPVCAACTEPLTATRSTEPVGRAPVGRGPVVTPAGIIGAGLIVVSLAVLAVIGARLLTTPSVEVAVAPTPAPTPFKSDLVRPPEYPRASSGPGRVIIRATPAPAPAPSPTPRRKPTPKPTQDKTRTSSGTTPTTGSGWTQKQYDTARAYTDRAFGLYADVVPRTAIDLWGYEIAPGLTEQEVAARLAEADLIRDPAVRAIKRHKSWMKSHPAAKCFQDAYAADRRLANQWLDLLTGNSFPGDYTGEGRALGYEYQEQLDRSAAFVRKLPKYFEDCR